MNLKQYFYPQIIKRFRSKLNRQVEVVQFSGAYRLDMGNLTQSGEVIERIWNRALKDLLPKDFTPGSVLMLGFGAGSGSKLIAKTWLGVNITGIELDPTVIKIARQYFGANDIPNLTLVNTDAIKFVHDLRSTSYDLILVDCYLGDQFPKSLESTKFLNQLTQLAPYVLINRLFWGEYQEPTLTFYEKLKQNYITNSTRTTSNFLISIQKPSGGDIT